VISPVASRWRISTSESAAISRWAYASLGSTAPGEPVHAMLRLVSHTIIARRLVSSSNCLT
jgi:hypothetical protein